MWSLVISYRPAEIPLFSGSPRFPPFVFFLGQHKTENVCRIGQLIPKRLGNIKTTCDIYKKQSPDPVSQAIGIPH